MAVQRLEDAGFDWWQGRGGAEIVRRVVEAATRYDGRSPLNEAALLTLQNRGLEGGVVFVADDAGFAYLHGLFGDGRPELDLAVAPEARGRGLGSALLAAVLDLAPDLPITAWSHGNHPAAASLAARNGFTATRELWLLRRPLDEPLPVVPVPEEVTLRPFRPGEDDESFLAVNAQAFARHPEQGSLGRRGLAERMAEPWFDPEGFLLATRGDDVLGFHWTKVHPAPEGAPTTGEVYVIGVSPAGQGRGLGKALLTAGLAHLRRRGLTEVILYVEAENRPAVNLYTGMGFTHADADTDVMYTRH